jgi:diacylglycerol kinase family enzyme
MAWPRRLCPGRGKQVHTLCAIPLYRHYQWSADLVRSTRRSDCEGRVSRGVLVAHQANPDDGKIVIHILKGQSKWALAKEWIRIALGVPFGPADIEVLRVPELTIDTIPKEHVAVDGEVITQTPIRVSVAREALLLMAPQGFEEFRKV